VNWCVYVDVGTTLLDLDPYLVWQTLLDVVDASEIEGANESARRVSVENRILKVARSL
jgi:hypothetical protein